MLCYFVFFLFIFFLIFVDTVHFLSYFYLFTHSLFSSPLFFLLSHFYFCFVKTRHAVIDLSGGPFYKYFFIQIQYTYVEASVYFLWAHTYILSKVPVLSPEFNMLFPFLSVFYFPGLHKKRKRKKYRTKSLCCFLALPINIHFFLCLGSGSRDVILASRISSGSTKKYIYVYFISYLEYSRRRKKISSYW